MKVSHAIGWVMATLFGVLLVGMGYNIMEFRMFVYAFLSVIGLMSAGILWALYREFEEGRSYSSFADREEKDDE